MGRSCTTRENGINPYIWCAVGGLLGWLVSLRQVAGGSVVVIENVLVGVFGAFIGGDFIVSMFNGGVVNDKDFHIMSLVIAVAGALGMLLVLRLLRRAVGPLRPGKRPPRRPP
jgi:uncharacterized membrane protein YeaQ/YmgE (transglycosylase-associated protein family)